MLSVPVQLTAWKDCPRNNLLCVKKDIKHLLMRSLVFIQTLIKVPLTPTYHLPPFWCLFSRWTWASWFSIGFLPPRVVEENLCDKWHVFFTVLHVTRITLLAALTAASELTSSFLHLPHTHTHTQPFYDPFSGTTQWAGARTELVGFMVQGAINRVRHTHHPAGRPPPPHSPYFFSGRMSFLPPNQQCQSTEGNISSATTGLYASSSPVPIPYN